MILLRISTTDEKTINRAAFILLEKGLAIDLNMKRHAERITLENGELKISRLFILTAKTKALLFSEIEKLFNSVFGDHTPELYSLPIVNMEWKQAERLAEKIRKL